MTQKLFYLFRLQQCIDASLEGSGNFQFTIAAGFEITVSVEGILKEKPEFLAVVTAHVVFQHHAAGMDIFIVFPIIGMKF